MSETTVIDHDDTETPEQRITKRALIEKGIDALDPDARKDITVHQMPLAGSVSTVDIEKVIELGKIMAAMQTAMPKHCRGNVGICIRIAFQAVEWNMSPFSVADLSYVVGDKIAYMSQLLHAVVEARAPLSHRLECDYEGEGPERICIVRGYFTTGDMREYRTPKFKDIRVKNSPLWADDPDQQQFYYASRAWARKWCPDVLLGIYTKEELQDKSMAEEAELGLHARLSSAAKSDEGHKAGHVESELDQVTTGGKIIEHEPGKQAGAALDKAKKKVKADKAQKTTKAKIESKSATPKAADKPPKTVAQYVAYARQWIEGMDDAQEIEQRWASERRMRNDIGVTTEDRLPLEHLKIERCEKLEK